MGTYAELKAQIATELKRSDQTANIEFAVAKAIERYAAKRFWFNVNPSSATLTANTVASNAYVTKPAGLRVIDKVFATVSGSPYPMAGPYTPAYIELLSGGAGTGQPVEWADYDDRIRVYPTPGAIYTLTFFGIYDLSELSVDADENAWTDEAEALIRARARAYIYANITEDADGLAVALAEERDALSALRAETTRRLARGRNSPRCM